MADGMMVAGLARPLACEDSPAFRVPRSAERALMRRC
jgi:hypothetical protein